MKYMRDELRKFMERFYNISETDGDTNLYDLGYVNSLFGQQLILFLEKKFNISVEIEDMDINNFSTINNILAFVKKKQLE